MTYTEILESDTPVMFSYKYCSYVLKEHGSLDEFMSEHTKQSSYDARYILHWLGY